MRWDYLSPKCFYSGKHLGLEYFEQSFFFFFALTAPESKPFTIRSQVLDTKTITVSQQVNWGTKSLKYIYPKRVENGLCFQLALDSEAIHTKFVHSFTSFIDHFQCALSSFRCSPKTCKFSMISQYSGQKEAAKSNCFQWKIVYSLGSSSSEDNDLFLVM
jgi:hypothetical protein